MSKTASGVAGLLLAAVSFGLGYAIAPSPAPPAPPTVRSAEQAARDAEAAGEIRGILLEGNSFARVGALAARLQTLGREDLPAVVDVLELGAVGLGSSEIDLLSRFWASYDPQPAVDWAWLKSPDYARSLAVYATLETAARADPEMARALLQRQQQQQSSKLDADVGREALVRGWFLSGRPGVEDYIRSLGHDRPQLRCLRALANVMIHRDGLEGLARWLEELDDEGDMFKKSAYRRATPELLRADRDFTLKWCDRVCDGPYGDHLRAIVAKTWAMEDGRAAMKWLSAAPKGEQTDRAVKAAFLGWTASDPQDLSRFLDEMRPEDVEPWFVPAAGRVAMWKSWDYPLEAYAWAALIPDDEKRELAYISITRRFREADESAAEAWLERSPLSPEARAKAREFPPKWRGRGKRPYPPPAETP